MKGKIVICLLLSLILLLSLCEAALCGPGGFLEDIKPQHPPGEEPQPLLTFTFPGAGPETAFEMPLPNGWKTVYTGTAEENPMYVIFMPQIPVQAICVTVENLPAMDSIEKYKELSKSPLYLVDQKYLTYVKDLKLIEKEDMIAWESVWHIKKGWKMGISDNTLEKNGGSEGMILNSMYIIKGVTFTITGYTIMAGKDDFGKMFGHVDQNFKPGTPPDAVATNQGQPPPTDNNQPENNGQTNNNTDISLTDTESRETAPPSLKILEPSNLKEERNLVVEYEGSTVHITGIADDESGVAQVIINGTEAQLTSVGEKNLQAVTEDMKKPLEFNSDILLTIGENKIEIVAVDVAGNKTTRTYTLNRVSDMGEVSPVKGEQWAVVIGISKFKNPGINPLNYTDDDAMAVYNYLITQGGFPEDHIKLLLNEEATTVNIRSALGEFLSRKAGKDDLVFIYFAGHGAPEADPASKDSDGYSKYMVTYDTEPESLYATAFPMSEIATIFDRIYAEKIVFFIDSCYSGASGGRTFSGDSGGRAMNISDNFLTEMSGKGRLIITASNANEISLEKDELGHGVFTYYMLEGLQGAGDTDGNGYITVDELYGFLYDKVADVSEQRQHPVKKGESEGQIVIGITKETEE